MGVSVRGADTVAPEADWGDSVRHDSEMYQNLTSLIDELALTFGALKNTDPLPFVKATEWSAAWETRLLTEAHRLAAVTESLQGGLTAFSRSIGVADTQDCSLEGLERFSRVARGLLVTADGDYRIIFDKKFAKLPAAVDQLENAVSAYQSAREQASAA